MTFRGERRAAPIPIYGHADASRASDYRGTLSESLVRSARQTLARLLLRVAQTPLRAIEEIEESAVSYTYYYYLDLPPGATAAQIESSYVALLERFGYGTTDAGQDMSGLIRMIHSAYAVLADAESRKRYDAELVREAAMADAELKASLDQQARHIQRVQNAPAALRNALAAVAA